MTMAKDHPMSTAKDHPMNTARDHPMNTARDHPMTMAKDHPMNPARNTVDTKMIVTIIVVLILAVFTLLLILIPIAEDTMLLSGMIAAGELLEETIFPRTSFTNTTRDCAAEETISVSTFLLVEPTVLLSKKKKPYNLELSFAYS
ncbi:hypothetical protein F4703DRAFT_1866620 [Phycomyces blakesleeanus]